MSAVAQPAREEPAAAPRAGGTDAAAPAALPPKRCPTCGGRFPDDYAVCPRDATPLAREGQTGDPLLGQILGDTYEIARMLGEGGMGRVYEARHVRLGRRFALKMLHLHFVSDAESVARFRREATAAAAVQSPYCAQVFDVHTTRDGRPYIVSELLEGEEFGALLKKSAAPMEVGRVVAIVRQVSRGLSAAHAAGVVHRDLKPENIYLVRTPEGREQAKVLDFGIAKSIAGDGSLTRTGVVLGTPAYMAPEQARSSAGLDHRVDIYALGAVLYRALTGQPAFTGEDPSTTLTSVLYDEPARPKALRRDLPDGLELVIQRAMCKAPEARFQSMAELDEALAPYDTQALADVTSAHAAVARATDPGAPGATPGAGSPGGPSVAGAATVALPAAIHTFAANASLASQRARGARPRAVAYSSLALGWCALATASLVGQVITSMTAHPLDATQTVLAVVLAAVVTVPLAVWWVRDLLRGTWRNTAAMLTRADMLEAACAASLGVYALIAVAWRAAHALIERTAAPPRWTDLVALGAALLVGGGVAWWQSRTGRGARA